MSCSAGTCSTEHVWISGSIVTIMSLALSVDLFARYKGLFMCFYPFFILPKLRSKRFVIFID